MFIQTESTPNPNTLKFVPGRVVMESGTADFTTISEAARHPLAKALFDLEGVVGVFYGRDFVSVTKDESHDWDLKPLILDHLVNFFAADGKFELDQSGASSKCDESGSDESGSIEKEIQELLNSRVRPAVAMDGGDIVFEKFEDGVVFLKLRGACAGCPSSTATLKIGIENMLRHYIPEVREVCAVV